MPEIHGEDEARDFLQGMGLNMQDIDSIQAYYDMYTRTRLFRVLVGVGFAHAFLIIVLTALLLS